MNLESISEDEEDVEIFKRGKQVLIIPPVADKSFYYQNETLRALWSEAFYKLYDSGRIYCIGYSFPEIDNFFRMFLFDSAMRFLDKEKIEFVFVNPRNEDFKRKYEEEFKRVFNVRYIDDPKWLPIVLKELEENKI